MIKTVDWKSPDSSNLVPCKLTLLIVEDNHFLRAVLRDMFSNAGIKQIHEASTLEKGLGVLRRLHVDVVLLDLKLPDGNGDTLLKEIYEEHYAAAVVINSFQYNLPLLVRCFRMGAAGYFAKGESKNALVHGVLRAARGEWIWTTEQLTQIAESEPWMSVGNSSQVPKDGQQSNQN